MRYAIIADIHANLAAFTAVLDDIERRGEIEEIWCLGDVVGYGPDPHQCIELLQQQKHVCIMGNHDLAAIGKMDTSLFNPFAAAACHWTIQQLNPTDVDYLENLPFVAERGDFTLAHGSPREPIWEYLLSISNARENFFHFKTQFCLVAHTHVPLIFRYTEPDKYSARPFLPDVGLSLGKDRFIINPGAVGQPRDSDPRASYAIYDSEARIIRLYRISYNINMTQRRMKEYKLPTSLASRLSYGQ